MQDPGRGVSRVKRRGGHASSRVGRQGGDLGRIRFDAGMAGSRDSRGLTSIVGNEARSRTTAWTSTTEAGRATAEHHWRIRGECADSIATKLWAENLIQAFRRSLGLQAVADIADKTDTSLCSGPSRSAMCRRFGQSMSQWIEKAGDPYIELVAAYGVVSPLIEDPCRRKCAGSFFLGEAAIWTHKTERQCRA